jgi:outer membrane receptor for ferric coprogen and ferric-rhodotorulic acid
VLSSAVFCLAAIHGNGLKIFQGDSTMKRQGKKIRIRANRGAFYVPLTSPGVIIASSRKIHHGIICALLASLGVTPAAWAETTQQEETTAETTAKTEAKAVTLEPVVVTGARYTSEVSVGGKEPVKPREIPQSVSVITKERIEDQGLVTVEDALNQVTGVTVISNETSQSQYRSRGYSLGVANDGIPAYNMFSGTQQLDLAIYEQVEVLRGPAGLYQGTGELGGVVNLARKRGLKEFAASGSVSAGSWNNYNAVADVGGPLNADGSLRGRVVASTVDREYFYDTTKTRKWVGYVTLDWDITPATTLSLALASQNDKTDAPYSGLPAWQTGELLKVSRSANPSPDWSRHEWDTQDLIAELSHRFDNGWKAIAKFRRRDQDFYAKEGWPGTGVSPVTGTVNYLRRELDNDDKHDAFDLYLVGPFRLFGQEHRAVLGYNREILRSSTITSWAANVNNVPFNHPELVSNPSFGSPYPWSLGNESETRQSGFYGQLRLRVTDPLTVIAGARVSDYRYRSRSISPSPSSSWETSASKTNDEVTPYAGLIFDVNRQVSLYASYSDIFVPQSQEKSGGGALDPRVGAQYEVGAKGEFFDGRLLASLAFFRLRDKNRPFEDPGNPNFYLNAGEVESKGWEVEVSGSPEPGWNVQAGYARLDTKYLKDETNKGLPFTTEEPKHTLRLWGTYRFGGELLNGLTAGLGANYASKSKAGNSANASLRAQDGYTVVNAFLSYRVNKNLTLSFNANNLFDKTYYTRLNGTVNTYNTYGAPRNFLLTLRAAY